MLRSRSPALLLLAVAFTAIPGEPAAGQEPFAELDGYLLRRYGVEEGLPIRWVQAMAQTPDGLLWVPTGDGLFHFDGERFRPAPPTHSTDGTSTGPTSTSPGDSG